MPVALVVLSVPLYCASQIGLETKKLLASDSLENESGCKIGQPYLFGKQTPYFLQVMSVQQ